MSLECELDLHKRLIERLQNWVEQLARYLRFQGETLESQCDDVQEMREYLGIVPQRVMVWDGMQEELVYDVRKPQVAVDGPSQDTASGWHSGGHPRRGETQSFSAPPKISAQTEQVSAQDHPSALALIDPSASASLQQSVLASLLTEFSMNHQADPSPGQLPATIHEGGDLVLAETVAGAASASSPNVFLIPPTLQTSQAAAAYALVSLVPMQTHSDPGSTQNADIADADADAQSAISVTIQDDHSNNPVNTVDNSVPHAEALPDHSNANADTPKSPASDTSPSHLLPPPPPRTPHSCSHCSPVPLEQLHQSPRLRSTSPAGSSKRALPSDFEAGVSSKRAKMAGNYFIVYFSYMS